MSTKTSKPWFHRFNRIAGAALLLALVAIVVSGPGYRQGLIELGTAFSMIRATIVLGLGALVSGVIATILGRKGTPKVWGKSSLLAIGLCGALLLTLGSWMKRGKELPYIHDITTDMQNPPAFVDIAPLRADAPNPVDYQGEEVAKLQREHYADIQPLMLVAATGDIINAANAAATDLGWEIVAIDPAVGRLEATDTTFWYGYKDDVVVRVADDGNRRRVDIRSKSRVGLSDLGTNAERVRKFIAAIEARLK